MYNARHAGSAVEVAGTRLARLAGGPLPEELTVSAALEEESGERAKNWRSGLPEPAFQTDPFGGRILAFVRGHGVERTSDRFWWPKLVYLQAALLTDTPLAALGRYAAGVNVTSDALAHDA